MILLYDSAIRVTELRELKVSSLNLTADITYIRVHGKGDKERIVSITDKTVEHIRKYMIIYHTGKDNQQPLFYNVINDNLSAMSTGNVERIINKYAEIIRPNHPTLPKKSSFAYVQTDTSNKVIPKWRRNGTSSKNTWSCINLNDTDLCNSIHRNVESCYDE